MVLLSCEVSTVADGMSANLDLDKTAHFMSVPSLAVINFFPIPDLYTFKIVFPCICPGLDYSIMS